MSVLVMVLYKDIDDHVCTNGVPLNAHCTRILPVLDVIGSDIESCPHKDCLLCLHLVFGLVL
jgi:hypothetical protein